jgi:hypothetical protein
MVTDSVATVSAFGVPVQIWELSTRDEFVTIEGC